MKDATTTLSGTPQDWPLSAADHKIELAAALDMIDAYTPSGYGGYFTKDTINGLINPANAGIRFYFTIHNGRLTVMLTGVQRIAVGIYDDLYNGRLAISDSLNVVAGNTDQSISKDNAVVCNSDYRASRYFNDGRKGGMFGTAAINAILTLNTGCEGIRFCFGSSASVKTIVLFAVDSSGTNLSAYVGDQNCPCPSMCSSNNPLNT